MSRSSAESSANKVPCFIPARLLSNSRVVFMASTPLLAGMLTWAQPGWCAAWSSTGPQTQLQVGPEHHVVSSLSDTQYLACGHLLHPICSLCVDYVLASEKSPALTQEWSDIAALVGTLVQSAVRINAPCHVKTTHCEVWINGLNLYQWPSFAE